MPKWMRGLIGFFLALLAVWIVSWTARAPKKEVELVLPKDPVKIEIRRRGDLITLEKKDAAWFVTSPLAAPADVSAVETLLAALKNLDAGEILSRRAESHDLYEVTEASGVALNVWGAEGKTTSLIVGKMAPDYSHVYLRVSPSPLVSLAAGLRREDVDRPLRQWRDRRVLPLRAEDEIAEIRFAGRRGAFAVRKSSDAWFVEGRPVDEAKMNTLLSRLRYFNADDFLDPPESENLARWGLTAPYRVVTVVTAAGKTFTLAFGYEDAASHRRPVRRDEEPTLFWLPPQADADFPQTPKDIQAPTA